MAAADFQAAVADFGRAAAAEALRGVDEGGAGADGVEIVAVVDGFAMGGPAGQGFDGGFGEAEELVDQDQVDLGGIEHGAEDGFVAGVEDGADERGVAGEDEGAVFLALQGDGVAGAVGDDGAEIGRGFAGAAGEPVFDDEGVAAAWLRGRGAGAAQAGDVELPAAGAQGIGVFERHDEGGVFGIDAAEDGEVAADEVGFFGTEGDAFAVFDQGAGGGDVAEAEVGRAQAELVFLAVAAAEHRVQLLDVIEDFAADEHAETVAGRDVDELVAVEIGREAREFGPGDVGQGGGGEGGVGVGEDGGVVGEGGDGCDVVSTAQGPAHPIERAGEDAGIGVEEQDVAGFAIVEPAVDGADEAEIGRVFEDDDASRGAEPVEHRHHAGFGRAIGDDQDGVAGAEIGEGVADAGFGDVDAGVDRDEDGNRVGGLWACRDEVRAPEMVGAGAGLDEIVADDGLEDGAIHRCERGGLGVDAGGDALCRSDEGDAVADDEGAVEQFDGAALEAER